MNTECWNCGSTPDSDWSCEGCRTERAMQAQIERLRAEIERLQGLVDAYAAARPGMVLVCTADARGTWGAWNVAETNILAAARTEEADCG